MKLVVATPYPEGSTLAIARAAVDHDSLAALYTSGHAWLITRVAAPDRLATDSRLQMYLHRREIPGIPSGLVKDRADGPELARAVVAHIPGLQGLGSRTMYAAKMAFDRAVACELPPCDAVVAIYGSAALTLRTARGMGALAVLNFVNSHPAEQNRYLRELAGLRPNHEFVPERVARRVERELSFADLVLVPSRFVANQLLERGLPEARVAVIPYGVDLEAFSPDANRPPNARVCCVYVGQISHRKGIPVLLRAARELPDVEFVLTGPSVTASLLRDLPPNARWIKPLPHAEVAALMRKADIFVLPAVEDAYPLAVLEAMASGVPVVVTDHVGTSEAIEPGVNGLVVPAGDHAALAGALRRLTDDADLRSRMGAAGRTRVASGHSWKAYATRVLSVVEGALTARLAG